MKPAICPICNGTGYADRVCEKCGSALGEDKCFGCDGKGWVEVHEEAVPYDTSTTNWPGWHYFRPCPTITDYDPPIIVHPHAL